MKRILIFTLLFPQLALIVFLWREMFVDGPFRSPPWEFMATAYIVASIPAWLTGAVDWGLEVKVPKLRVVGTTLAGALIATGFAAVTVGFSYPSFLQVTLMGAIPAALCSLLSSKRSA